MKEVSYRVQGQYKNRHRCPNTVGEWKGELFSEQMKNKQKTQTLFKTFQVN